MKPRFKDGARVKMLGEPKPIGAGVTRRFDAGTVLRSEASDYPFEVVVVQWDGETDPLYAWALDLEPAEA
jgi:hypothetical protein